MHFGDLFSEFPRRAVLKVSEASLQFMPAVDVKNHQPDPHAQYEISERNRQAFRTRIQGTFQQPDECVHLRCLSFC